MKAVSMKDAVANPARRPPAASQRSMLPKRLRQVHGRGEDEEDYEAQINVPIGPPVGHGDETDSDEEAF